MIFIYLSKSLFSGEQHQHIRLYQVFIPYLYTSEAYVPVSSILSLSDMIPLYCVSVTVPSASVLIFHHASRGVFLVCKTLGSLV